MIFAMLRGELPPRALDGVDERSSVQTAKEAVLAAFKADGRCLLRSGDVELDDAAATLDSYGVGHHALLYAEVT
jgi:hypothetical protein